MNNTTLKLSGETMDTLFIDLLNDNLTRILEVDSNPHISLDDHVFNLRLAKSILSLMMFYKDDASFDQWFTSTYRPALENYNSYYKDYAANEY